MTLLTYRFVLDPTPAQERALRSHAGAARVAFSWGLARVKAVMDQRAAEATYGSTAEALTPSMSWSLVVEDLNADYGTRYLAGSGPDSNGRGADHTTGPARQVALKRQPCTAPAGQTGTVPTQDGTAA